MSRGAITKAEIHALHTAMRWALSTDRASIGVEDNEMLSRELLYHAVKALAQTKRWRGQAKLFAEALDRSRSKLDGAPFYLAAQPRKERERG